MIALTSKKNNNKIYTSERARHLSLLSRSRWKERGRYVPPNTEPFGYVVTKTERVHGLLATYIVVTDLGNERYLVADQADPRNCYAVFAYDQTVQKSGALLQVTSNLSPLPLPSLPSYVPPLGEHIDVTPYNSLMLRRKNVFRKAVDVNKAFWAYVPESLTDVDRHNLGDDLGVAYCVFYWLHFFRVSQKRPKDAWIDLSSVFCEDFFGWRLWSRVKQKLIAADIMEITKRDAHEDDYGLGVEVWEERGVKGGRCYGYRLREDLRHSIHRKVYLTDRKAVKLLKAYKSVHGYTRKWLRKNLECITIAPVPDVVLQAIAADEDQPGEIIDKVAAYREQIRWINDKAWKFIVDDFSGRIHTTVTQLKRELRPFLRVNGLPLAQIDIKCCQLLLIGWLAKEAGLVDARYLRICEDDLYSYIAEKLSLNRKDVKLQLMQRGLFSSNRSRHQQTVVMRFFAKDFPKIMAFVRQKKRGAKTKDNLKPHNRLACAAQMAEVEFVIDRVCARIRRERPATFVTTIHDSLLFLPDNADYVMFVMADEFNKLHLRPKLEVQIYGEDQEKTSVV